MKTISSYFKIAVTAVFTVFVFQSGVVYGQEDLINNNHWQVIPPIANNIVAADQTI